MNILSRLLISITLISTPLVAADTEIVDGFFHWHQARIKMPVDEGWYVGPPSKSGYPSIILRISDDQVLNIMFINDDDSVPIRDLADGYLGEMAKLTNFKIIVPLQEVKDLKAKSAFYFEFERDKSDSVRYRQGVFVVATNSRPLVAIPTLEASQDAKYIERARELLRKIIIN